MSSTAASPTRAVRNPSSRPRSGIRSSPCSPRHKTAGEATQVHDHYLKGSVYCGACGSRLIISDAKNTQGNVYPYFVCGGRYSKRTECARGAVLIEDVERLIEDYYTRIQIAPAVRQTLAGFLHHEFDRLMSAEADELAQLTANRDRLENE